jgi:hypothetical protein
MAWMAVDCGHSPVDWLGNASGLQEGPIESPSPKGPLQPGFPPKIVEFYFPQLVVDRPIDEPKRDGR